MNGGTNRKTSEKIWISVWESGVASHGWILSVFSVETFWFFHGGSNAFYTYQQKKSFSPGVEPAQSHFLHKLYRTLPI